MVEEGSVSPFIAKLTEPYVSDNFPDELTIGYQFQNNLTQVGDYMTVGHLKITVYNEENIVIGQLYDFKENNEISISSINISNAYDRLYASRYSTLQYYTRSR